MKQLSLVSPRVTVTAAILVLGAGLTCWAILGAPSTVALAWTAAVGVGLIVAIALAVRDGAATRSIAHVLYDTEHPLSDSSGEAARPQIRS